MVRWWWFGIAAERPEILRELQQMKADGIGGVELAFEYPQVVDDPAKGLTNQPFLSPAMLDDVRYAQSEGTKLGLRVDVTLGSGWPYGGPSTALAEAAGQLRVLEIPSLRIRPTFRRSSWPRANPCFRFHWSMAFRGIGTPPAPSPALQPDQQYPALPAATRTLP